jgi:hypothetical protein
VRQAELGLRRTVRRPGPVTGRQRHASLSRCPLARMELELALDVLLTRLPGLRLAVPTDDLHRRPGMVMRNLTTLPVTWDHARKRQP